MKSSAGLVRIQDTDCGMRREPEPDLCVGCVRPIFQVATHLLLQTGADHNSRSLNTCVPEATRVFQEFLIQHHPSFTRLLCWQSLMWFLLRIEHNVATVN